MLTAFASAFRTPDLRKKLLFTLAMIGLYRLGASLPTPNTNSVAINACIKSASGTSQTAYALINLFSGGALLKLSVFARGRRLSGRSRCSSPGARVCVLRIS